MYYNIGILPGNRKVALSSIRARDFTFEAHLLAAQGRAITFLLLAGNRARVRNLLHLPPFNADNVSGRFCYS